MYEHYRPIPETGQTPQRPRSEKPEDKEFADMLASGNIHTAPKYHDMDLPFEYKYFDYLCRGIPDSLDAKRHHPKVIFTQ